jgi:rsbT co-antagonist protein RsbR
MAPTRISEIIDAFEADLLQEWVQAQMADRSARGRLTNDQLYSDSRSLLTAMRESLRSGDVENIQGTEWKRVRDFLVDLSRQRAERGFTPSETATFVLSLKQPLFARLRKLYANDAQALAEEIWATTQLVDRLGLFTTDVFLQTREAIITRQQEDMLELSTPVVTLYEGVLALPLIGTLDSARTQVVMQNLLQAIVDHHGAIAIIDITGVPTVDTLVAQHLLKTVAAARLMGADCIISGIRPQIAQTIIHLGVELSDVTTKATLADAFQSALRRIGMAVRPVN